MNDKDYSKREHDLLFAEIRESLNSMRGSLGEIKEQVTKTNERVTLLELWKENSLGKLSIIMIAVGIGVSIFVAWVGGLIKNN